MMFFQKRFSLRLLIFGGMIAVAIPLFAEGVPIGYDGIARSGSKLPSDLARRVEDAFSVGQMGWLELSHFTAGVPDAFPMKSRLGTHYGWPYRQKFGLGVLVPFEGVSATEDLKKSAPLRGDEWRYGFVIVSERRGWAEEDFYAVRHEGEFSAGWSGHLFGAMIDRPMWGAQFGAGVVGRNRNDWPLDVPKEREQPWMGWGRIGWGALQTWLLAGKEIEGWSVALDLEKRALGDQPTGWMGYMPRIRLEGEGVGDSLHFEWEQPLWNHRAYLRTRWSTDRGLEWGELAYYPDPSRLIAFAATVFVEENENVYGGLIRFLIAEFGYSYAPEIEALGGMKRSVYAQLRIPISVISIQNHEGRREDFYSVPGAGGFTSEMQKMR